MSFAHGETPKLLGYIIGTMEEPNSYTSQMQVCSAMCSKEDIPYVGCADG